MLKIVREILSCTMFVEYSSSIYIAFNQNLIIKYEIYIKYTILRINEHKKNKPTIYNL